MEDICIFLNENKHLLIFIFRSNDAGFNSFIFDFNGCNINQPSTSEIMSVSLFKTLRPHSEIDLKNCTLS